MNRMCWMVLVVAACSSPAKSPKPSTATTTAAAASAETRVIISHGRKSGSFVLTPNPDGSIGVMLDILQNGRGPHIDGTLQLAADGTLESFAGTGHWEMGTKLSETYSRQGTTAIWKSIEEQGESKAAAGAFFVPLSPLHVEPWLVKAAQKNGGTIKLLPAGTARVEQVGEAEVSSGGSTKHLVAYAISGVDLRRSYTWFERDGAWFGSVSPWRSMIPPGWESVIDPLIAKQETFEREGDNAIYAAAATKAPAAGVAFTHARLLDVEAGKWLEDQTVVVVGDTIKAVGKTGKVAVPKGAQTVDLTGRALLPGLVDMHSHLDRTDAVLDIASGVTTARDVGNDPDILDKYKAWFDEGSAVGPRLVRMGFIEGRNEKAAASKVTAETPEEAKAAVEEFAKRGYEGIKIYNSMKTDLVPILTEAAHAKGMLVTGHIPVHMLANEAVRSGYDGIEHINMLFLNFLATHDTDTRTPLRFTLVGDKASSLDLASKPVLEFFTLLRERKTVIDPTLVAFQDLWLGEPGKIVPGFERVVTRLPVQVQRGFLINGLPTEGDKRELYQAAWKQALALVKALYDAKVQLVVGTDHIGGLALHWEMHLFAQAGIPNAAILKMATIDAARAMRLDSKQGSIKVGKRADMFVVTGDPLANIDDLTTVSQTMSRGVLFDSQKLYEAVGVGPNAAAR